MLLQALLMLSLSTVLLRADDDFPRCSASTAIIRRTFSDWICPNQAVCGDEWNFVRNWYNGTRCAERRITLHCACPPDPSDPWETPLECPMDDLDYAIYASRKHTYFTCRPRCNNRRCETRETISKELVQGDPNFPANYYKDTLTRSHRHPYIFFCRCPGHDDVNDGIDSPFFRATRFRRLRLLRIMGTYRSIVKVQYSCKKPIDLNQTDSCQGWEQQT